MQGQQRRETHAQDLEGLVGGEGLEVDLLLAVIGLDRGSAGLGLICLRHVCLVSPCLSAAILDVLACSVSRSRVPWCTIGQPLLHLAAIGCFAVLKECYVLQATSLCHMYWRTICRHGSTSGRPPVCVRGTTHS